MTHSILPPSSAARRMACPGSRALEAKYPREKSPEALEGETAHIVAAGMLRRELFSVGDFASNGEIITQEMINGGGMYVTEINSEFPYGKDRLHIEEKIKIEKIHPECFGTPDCWFFDCKEQVLYLFDYKYGFKPVEAFENWQLLEYAIGIMELIKFPSAKIRFCIIQPRDFLNPIKYWWLPCDGLESYFEILCISEEQSMRLEAKREPTPTCGYCSARHACNSLRNAALSFVDNTNTQPDTVLQPEQLGSELRYLKQAQKLLEARISGLEEQALHGIKNGKRIPFFNIKQSFGRERWFADTQKIAAVGDLHDVELRKSMTLITPKQARDAGLNTDIVNNYSEVLSGEFKLVEDDLKDIRKILNEK